MCQWEIPIAPASSFPFQSYAHTFSIFCSHEFYSVCYIFFIREFCLWYLPLHQPTYNIPGVVMMAKDSSSYPIISQIISRDADNDVRPRCRKTIQVYRCGLIEPPIIERCVSHLDVTKWPCQHPILVIQYLCIDCAGENISRNDSIHNHNPVLAMENVERKAFKSYFDYIAAKWRLAHHCRQVCYLNTACGRIHFHALECQRKRERPRRDQSCCGKREWIIDTADEKCKHPECLSDKCSESWWSKITDVLL